MLALDGKGNLTKQRQLGRRATAEQRRVTWSSEEAKSDRRASYTVSGGVGSTASRIDNAAPSSKMLLQINEKSEEMKFVPNLFDV